MFNIKGVKMVGIITDSTKEKILDNDKQKLREQLAYRQGELGLRGMKPMRNQNQLQQLEDIQNNQNKIRQQMEQANERSKKIRQKKRKQQQAQRMKKAPQIYMRKKNSLKNLQKLQRE